MLNNAVENTGITAHSAAAHSKAKKDIYIDSLPASYTATEFASLFAEYKTTALNFKKHRNGSQTGFGFVSLESESEAQRAIRDLNGTVVKDQIIRVQPSTKAETSQTNLYVEGIPPSWDEATLKSMYEQFGEIAETKVLVDHNTNSRTGVGFIHFVNADSAQEAITRTNGTTPSGHSRALAVRFARRKTANRQPFFNNSHRGGYGHNYGPRNSYGGYNGMYGGNLYQGNQYLPWMAGTQGSSGRGRYQPY